MTELLPLVCCPVTRLPLRIATADEAGRFGLESALIRADGTAAYPIRNGIPILLPEEIRSISDPNQP